MSSRYPPHSIVDPRIQVRSSEIEGRGLFAIAPIRAGERIVLWGGTVFTETEYRAGLARVRSLGVIGEGLYIGTPVGGPEHGDEFMNHSCTPNVWMDDEITLVAMRDIACGEEVTVDYALWETDPEWSMPCACGAEGCRGAVTGEDWRRPDLQRRYRSHFSPYIEARIRALEEAGSD